MDPFWWEEFDVKNQGTHMMHRMIVQNTNIKCLQQDVFFYPNDKTNPIVCYNIDNIPGPENSWWLKPIMVRTFFLRI